MKGIVHCGSQETVSHRLPTAGKLQLLYFEINCHLRARAAPCRWLRSIPGRLSTPLTVSIILRTPSWLCWPFLDWMAICNTSIKSQFPHSFMSCITSYSLSAFSFFFPVFPHLCIFCNKIFAHFIHSWLTLLRRPGLSDSSSYFIREKETDRRCSSTMLAQATYPWSYRNGV